MVTIGSTLDIDGNDQVDALSDGLLVQRYLLGFVGDILIDGALCSDAVRKTASGIIQYLDESRATMLDVDANGDTDAYSDGALIISRQDRY